LLPKHLVATEALGSLHTIERGANVFPLYLRPLQQTIEDAEGKREPRPNLSDAARAYLASVSGDAAALFHHALATLHAPAYREENAGALRQDWPRVPLPATGDALRVSAAFGREVAALLDTETPVPGVTEPPYRPTLLPLAPVRRVGGGNLNTATDLAVTAGWGHGGSGAPVMPARGKTTEREYTADERAALTAGDADALALLGATCYDVYLNEAAYWACVPVNVWRYTLGGYQVLKKWLSYRERRVLGRDLRTDEVREATAIARRVAALLLLAPALDANYAAMAGATFAPLDKHAP